MLQDPAGIQPEASWSPVGRASNWATEASEWALLSLILETSNVANRVSVKNLK